MKDIFESTPLVNEQVNPFIYPRREHTRREKTISAEVMIDTARSNHVRVTEFAKKMGYVQIENGFFSRNYNERSSSK